MHRIPTFHVHVMFYVSNQLWPSQKSLFLIAIGWVNSLLVEINDAGLKSVRDCNTMKFVCIEKYQEISRSGEVSPPSRISEMFRELHIHSLSFIVLVLFDLIIHFFQVLSSFPRKLFLNHKFRSKRSKRNYSQLVLNESNLYELF